MCKLNLGAAVCPPSFLQSMICKALTEGKLGCDNFSWRLLMLPLW
jgi:hypothetical protein